MSDEYAGRRKRLQGETVLAAIVCTGLLLRIGWMVTQAPVISSDGGVYATMAENLFHRRGLVGTGDGPELLYAPLYPALIATAMLSTGNSELAGHVVSLLSGTVLIVLVYLTARRVYDQRTALFAAALVAVHPLLIALSASVYNEALYLTIWMAIVLCSLSALERWRIRDSLILGAVIGLAYLSRVEAFAYVLIFAAVLLAAGLIRRNLGGAVVRAATVAAVFLVVGAPYIGYLYKQTDALRLQAKWDINYTMARNRLAGRSYMEADYGIRPDLTVEGPLLAPNEFVNTTPYSHTLTDQLSTLASIAEHNARTVYHFVLDRQIGAPMILALLIVGFCRTPWSNARLRHEMLLLVMASSIVAVVLTSATGEERYIFPLVPVLLVWSAKGLVELSQWIAGWEAVKDSVRVRPALVAAVLQVSAIAAIVGPSVKGVQDDFLFWSERSGAASAAREAGLWLAQQKPVSSRIAVSRSAVVPYYAKRIGVALPYGDSDATRRYIAKRNVDFVVLESEEAPLLPVVGQWMDRGIPDPHARLLYDRTNKTGNRVVIYRWVDQ
jgi:4-amino-4-deoxy-L-arabinose transferase-like glycosyltransferase